MLIRNILTDFIKIRKLQSNRENITRYNKLKYILIYVIFFSIKSIYQY
jgi:hypothetical protein